MLNINGIILPLPGQLCEAEGGIFDGIIIGDDGRAHLQFSAPRGSEGDMKDVTWGEYGKDTGATSDRDGLANTKAMAEAGSETAIKVLALDFNGHSDWQIPAPLQARLQFTNSAHHFDTDDWYWLSKQYSPYSAWCQTFGGGDRNDDGKSYTARVRVVRSRPIE